MSGMSSAGEERTPIERIFHALADPTRRQMVERASQGPVTVSELARPFAITLAAAVQHVQVLEQSGLVHTEKQGRVRLVQLNPACMAVLRAWVEQRGNPWEHRLGLLGDMLDRKNSR